MNLNENFIELILFIVLFLLFYIGIRILYMTYKIINEDYSSELIRICLRIFFLISSIIFILIFYLFNWSKGFKFIC
jgi:hypothetical protein